MASFGAAAGDADLQLALEISAREARSKETRSIVMKKEGANSQVPLPRRDRGVPLRHHFSGRNNVVRDGFFLSAPGLLQFHSDFQPLIDKYGTAGSICGYLTCAVAQILAERARDLKRSEREGVRLNSSDVVEFMLQPVKNVDLTMKRVEEAMKSVRASRLEWIDKHPNLFKTVRSRRNHLRNWVANYELSDALAANVAPLITGDGVPVDFVRYNQYHEISKATPDEYVRIMEEEKRFGGKADAEKPGKVTFGEHDSVFIVERFEEGRRVLQSPDEWKAEETSRNIANRPSGNYDMRIFAADLNGHFSAGFSLEPGICVMVNTTTSRSYVESPILNWYYDLRFAPTPSSSAGTKPAYAAPTSHGGKNGSSAASASGVSSLVDMGFSLEVAHEALQHSEGDVATALNILLQAGDLN